MNEALELHSDADTEGGEEAEEDLGNPGEPTKEVEAQQGVEGQTAGTDVSEGDGGSAPA